MGERLYSILRSSNMHTSCLPGLNSCHIGLLEENAAGKKKSVDRTFLTWLPILPLGLVKLPGTFRTRVALKVCRRETPSAGVASSNVAHSTFISKYELRQEETLLR